VTDTTPPEKSTGSPSGKRGTDTSPLKPDSEDWHGAMDEMFIYLEQLEKEFGFTERMRKNALVLLGSAYVGHSPTRLSQFTGVAAGFIRRRKQKLFDSGIWTADGKVACAWLDDYGEIALVCDVLVLEGKLEKVYPEEPEEPEEKPAAWGNGNVLLF